MNERVAKRLLDARLAASAIQDFVAGSNFATYSASEMLISAVERKLGIVEEALNQAAREWPELETEIPSLPRIVGIRNRIAHGYDEVDQQVIWDVIQRHLPLLNERLDQLLGEDAPRPVED